MQEKRNEETNARTNTETGADTSNNTKSVEELQEMLVRQMREDLDSDWEVTPKNVWKNNHVEFHGVELEYTPSHFKYAAYVEDFEHPFNRGAVDIKGISKTICCFIAHSPYWQKKDEKYPEGEGDRQKKGRDRPFLSSVGKEKKMSLDLNYEARVLVDTEPLTNEEWLVYRRKGIGGSDCAAIMGCSPFTTLRDLYYDKTGIKPVADEENKNWVQLEVGHRLEELVAQIFSRKTGLEVYSIRKMFQHPLYPFMLADVDFFIKLPNGKTGILECKTTNYNNQDKWANDSTPVNYEYQGRHYMAVMNLDEVYFACLYGNSENEFFIRHMERDLDIEEELIAEEENFWNEYVLKKVEPPYTEKPDLVLASIRKHVGPADKDADKVKLSRTLQKNLDSYLLLKAEKAELDAKSKKLEEQMKNCYTEVVEELGSSCEGTLTDGKSIYTVKYNPQYRTSVNKDNLERLKANYPDVYDDYVSTSETRIFSVKKKEVA